MNFISQNHKDLEYREKKEIAKEVIKVFQSKTKPVTFVEYDKV